MYAIKRMSMLSLLALTLFVPGRVALAQDEPLEGKKAQPRQPEGREDRPEREGRRRQGDGGPGGFMDPQRTVDRLTEELNLTQQQQTRIKEILEHRRDTIREMREGGPGIKPEDREKVRELREQMRQAREDGDREKIDTLREEMRKFGGGDPREAFLKAQMETDQQIKTILTPEQQKKYDEIRANMMRGFRGDRGGPINARVLHDAVMRLELGSDQKAKIDALFDKSREAEKDLKRDDRQTRTENLRKLREAVVAELTPEQAQQLEKNIQRAEGRGRGEGRPGRAQRARPGQDQRGGDRDDKDG